MHPTASVLAIGTELTTGQVTNRNAPWISERLAELGVETTLHLTVADDRARIRQSLDLCARESQLIFVTGGLGPTTDDFTREVVAEWLGKPLRHHEPSWTKIQTRLTRMGIPVAESNRQQCNYPDGAEVIPNPQGTADAFTARHNNTQLWVLPGPPREVDAVWRGGIEAQVRARIPGIVPERLLTWQCIGKSEAELGELTERALAGAGLKIGYRAHRPYVEIKVWCPEPELPSKKSHLDALEQAIAPWIATRQGEDLAARLLTALGRADEIAIADACSGGVLAERLGSPLREPRFAAQAAAITLATEWIAPVAPEEWVRSALSQGDETALTLAIAGFDPQGEWAFGLREHHLLKIETTRTPYLARERGGPEELMMNDRSRRYAVEFALKRWGEWLKDSVQ